MIAIAFLINNVVGHRYHSVVFIGGCKVLFVRLTKTGFVR
jgi:hypothetical protein